MIIVEQKNLIFILVRSFPITMLPTLDELLSFIYIYV